MKLVPPYIRFLAGVALLSLLLMTLFRVLLYIITLNVWISNEPHLFQDIVRAFLIGFRFDIVITAYVLVLPFMVLGIASFFSKRSRILNRGVLTYLIAAYTILLFILCADIPYSLHFYSRLTTAALLWTEDTGYMAAMIFNEWTFLIYLILFVIFAAGTAICFARLCKKLNTRQAAPVMGSKRRVITVKVVSFIILGLILMISVRGRLSIKAPIKTGTAYFSDDQVMNRIAQNPVFTFVHSLLTDLNSGDRISLMDDKEALELSSSFLSLPVNDSATIRLRETWKLKNGPDTVKKNIVIIIMESMGMFKLGKFNGPKNLTPNLNRIISNSIYFDNIYTAGIHTFNGLYSTLFSFPALYKHQPLEELMDVPHTGIAQVLRNYGYTTSYFTTHDPQFDNVSGFFKANGYQNIFSEYPGDWVMSNNGVPDHIMFGSSVSALNELSGNGDPFFAVILTSSDHKPYIIPEDIDFKPNSELPEHRITEYADWSIGYFFEQASEQGWYANTTFVLIADHGLNMGHTYDMPLSYHATPLIIYTPSSSYIRDTLHNLGGQIDVAPTVLGLLNIPYENNTMGIDLFVNKRPFMYFCADDKIGCLDNEYYLIIRPGNIETLYKYENLQTTNYIDQFRSKVDSMKNYTFSMMQATQARTDPKLRLTKK
jgi:phosphoglycerol transferase MdoB-like AlkP superfamily enzyme